MQASQSENSAVIERDCEVSLHSYESAATGIQQPPVYGQMQLALAVKRTRYE